MKKLILLLATALFLTDCGGAGTSTGSNGTAPKTETASSKLTAKVGEKDYSFEIKDALIWNSSNDGLDEAHKNMKAPNHSIILGNYDFGGEPARTVPEGKYKVVVGITGDWIAKDAEIVVKPGVYATGKNGPMTVANNNIVFIENGKEVQNYKTYGFSGEVKITSVEGETVKGEIDIKTDTQQTKGSFTAKIYKPKM